MAQKGKMTFVFAVLCFLTPTLSIAEEEMAIEIEDEGISSATLENFKGVDETGTAVQPEEIDGAICEDGCLDESECIESEYLVENFMDLQSIPCSPGSIIWESRVALGALLDGTPADLDGTDDRETWFASFPQTQVFPMGAEIAGIKWRFNTMGTVGLVTSTSPWPIWDNASAPPTSDADCVAIAEAFLADQQDLIMLEGRMYELVVDHVVRDDAGWKVVFLQTHQRIPVLGTEVAVWGRDETGDVFGMQNNYVPNLAADVQPTVQASELPAILADWDGHPELEHYVTDDGPYLVVAHTRADFCDGTLLWWISLTTASDVPFACLVDAHRGSVHGCSRLDGTSADNYRIYNFAGNHPRNVDVSSCGPLGGSPCNWMSSEETNIAQFEQKSEWYGDEVILNPPLSTIPAGGYHSAARCYGDDNDCSISGDPFEDPPVPLGAYVPVWWNSPPMSAASLADMGGSPNDGEYFEVYESTAGPPITIDDGCPGNIHIADVGPPMLVTFDPSMGGITNTMNPWSIWDTSTPIDNERNPCKWISDDVNDVVAYLHDMRDFFDPVTATITTLPGDIVDDFPDFDVQATEPYDPDDLARAQSPFDNNDQSVHFNRGTSHFSSSSSWTPRLRILASPERYIENFNANLDGNDDTVYHEMGHMISQGVLDAYYAYSVNPSTAAFQPGQCQMWHGLWHESFQDVNAAVMERYRFDNGLVQNANPNGLPGVPPPSSVPEHVPDWTYGEGGGGTGRDMQHPDTLNGAGGVWGTRRPESLNDYTIPRTDNDIDRSGAESEEHIAAGLLNRFFFLMGNDLCDYDDGCGDNANTIQNDPCSCAAGWPKCRDNTPPLDEFRRADPRNHTIVPPASCNLSDSASPTGDGYQQYHFGVKSKSLDRAYLGGENGRERLGRLHYRLLFEDSPPVTHFLANEEAPWGFMDAFESVITTDTAWFYPDTYVSDLVNFYSARDSVGFWTQLGNYWDGFTNAVLIQGVNGAFVRWSFNTPPVGEDPAARNTEIVYTYNPLTYNIASASRRCFKQDANSDGTMDYCFAGSPWSYAFVDQQLNAASYTLYPKSTPAIDVNVEDVTGADANYGKWLVYRMDRYILSTGITTNGICRKRLPLIAPNDPTPNVGGLSARQCEYTYQTTARPGVGHYVVSSNPVTTAEVVVFTDKNAGNTLKSFIWNSNGSISTLRTVQPGACGNQTPFRPEVVAHDDHVWAFWVPADGDRLCYSRYLPFALPSARWEDARSISFDEQMDSCGDILGSQDRLFAGPPSATVRNGIIHLLVRDRVRNGGEPWIWSIQLNDAVGPHVHDGMFNQCQDSTVTGLPVEECTLGRSCWEDCDAPANWEERSPWLPYVPFYASPLSVEIGGLATTQPLTKMSEAGVDRRDYTFFYNPSFHYSATGAAVTSDFAVWARESW